MTECITERKKTANKLSWRYVLSRSPHTESLLDCVLTISEPSGRAEISKDNLAFLSVMSRKDYLGSYFQCQALIMLKNLKYLFID